MSVCSPGNLQAGWKCGGNEPLLLPNAQAQTARQFVAAILSSRLTHADVHVFIRGFHSERRLRRTRGLCTPPWASFLLYSIAKVEKRRTFPTAVTLGPNVSFVQHVGRCRRLVCFLSGGLVDISASQFRFRSTGEKFMRTPRAAVRLPVWAVLILRP